MMKNLLSFFCFLSTTLTIAAVPGGTHDHDHDHDHVQPMSFIQNNGQWDPAVRFKADVRGATVFLENGGLTYSKLEENAFARMHDAAKLSPAEREAMVLNGHVWKMRFVDPSPEMQISTGTAAAYYHNYFIGNDRSKWASSVPLFEQVTYSSLWPGIDMVLHSDEGHLKYDLIVAPNTDMSRIAFIYEGAESMQIGLDGELIMRTSVGDVMEMRPQVFYQDDVNEVILSSYELVGNELRFAFPAGFDASRTIVIDPTLVASTMSGTNVNSYGHCATFDDEGNIYTGAIAFGQGYNTTPGSFQTTFGGGNTDVAISKYDPTGAELIYATYVGGNGGDYPHSLIVDGTQALWILATTNSSDHPVSADAYDPTFNGGVDIVVTRLSQDGQSLIGASYFGGSGEDGRNQLTNNYGDNFRGEIIIDQEGNAYIASSTQSNDIPVSEEAVQIMAGGGQDGLVFSLDPTLSILRWATYLGGSTGDAAFGLRVAADGTVVVAGGTASNDFPTTAGVVHPSQLGGNDAFVSRISSDGTTLLASTYWGTASDDNAFFVDLDMDGNAYIYGQTGGQITIQPAGTYGNPGGDIFVSKLDMDLTSTVISTVLGTSGGGGWNYTMAPIAFMVDQCSRIYISGHGGLSPISGMPVTPDNFQTTGGFYVAAFEDEMAELLFGTYYGSTSDHVDGGTSRFDPRGVIYQGVCTGGGFPTTPWAYSNSSPPGWDIAVFKIDMEQSGVHVGIQTETTEGCVPATFEFVATGNSPIYYWDLNDGSPQTTGPTLTHTYEEVGIYTITLYGIDSATCNISDTTMITVTVGDAEDPVASFEADPISSCTGYGAEFTITSPATSSVSWDFGDGGTSSQPDPTHTYDAPGTYEVWLTVIDDVCGGTDSTMVTVDIPPATLDYELDSPVYLCDDSAVLLDAGGGFSTYEWSDGSNAQMISATGPGEYSVTVTEGFCTGTAVIEVLLAPGSPRIEDAFGCPGMETVLAVPFVTNDVMWNTGADSSAIVVTETGTYWYTAVDPYGCTVLDTVEVLVVPVEEALATIPNVFSPNGDGMNDRFQIDGVGLENFHMEVFNRWGQLMFSSSDPASGWNGGRDNSLDHTPEGTYFYVISFRDRCSGQPHSTHHGAVTLLR